VKIVFMGTPEFAAPTLNRLCDSGLAPVAVYTQPARPRGRGLKIAQTPVGTVAQTRGLELRQPRMLQSKSEMEFLRDLAPDLIITAAFGRIFRKRLLTLPRLGCINLHPSLLPRYRGLAPVTWALLAGDAKTGVTVYRMVADVDAGPILTQRIEPVLAEDTCATLTARLADIGADLVCETVSGLAAGTITAYEQNHEQASFALRMEKSDGCLDWDRPALEVENLVRAYDPWPGTYTFFGETRLKVLAVKAVDEVPRDLPPGTFLRIGGKRPPLVAANPGAVELRDVQCANCRPIGGDAFCCGQRVSVGDQLKPCPAEGGDHD
jgi:methionyl-tRNA formyltransferase